MNNQETMVYWVKERLSILDKRNAGLPKPWTDDPILQNYRFCNVRREDDVVTKWIKNNWRDKSIYAGSAYMPLAMVVARTVNRTDTLSEIEFPYGHIDLWMEDARVKMKARRARGDKVWTGAYLVSTNGNAMDKIDYIIDKVWKPVRANLRYPKSEESLQSYWQLLTQFDGLGSFMAAQVVCDLKYTRCLEKASDWWRWAALGPGSIRGINRYLDKPPKSPLKQDAGLAVINKAQGILQSELGVQLHAQDVQNVFCEYSKYMKILLKEGQMRSRYNGQG